jgi:2-keto-4-pentenoate hydratase/2-oxohepta-3-ene-1,7-dioic acid hydratase in catechol pathway/regulator of RNase E activity RraA
MEATPGAAPTKVVCVHLSYRSRAAERGRMPRHPSYFLKPTTTIAGSGDPIVRPQGCELLAFEGEIALIIGSRAHRVREDDAWDHVGFVTAANDFGVYDLRYADGGSNLRSKGIDGFTPIGPTFLPASGLDPDDLELRCWVNGEPVQRARVRDDLLFGFPRMVADLSRLMTLEPGDVILTGTPTGSSVVQPGDVVEVEVAAEGRSTGRLRSPITESREPLAALGAMPQVDDDLRVLAHGRRPPAVDDDRLLARLSRVSTATLASQLRRRGFDHLTMDRLQSTRPDLRMCGRARTVRYLPARPDQFALRGGGMNAQKRSVEALRPGEVLVIDARGESDAGTIGDILALRAVRRGAAGVVSDGALRDSGAFGVLNMPIYHRGVHPAVLGRRHVPWDTDLPVACGGVLVRPGDLLVGDSDGVVLVPDEVAEGVAADAIEQERQERFITERVAAGEGIDGLYPIGPARRDDYERWCREQGD